MFDDEFDAEEDENEDSLFPNVGDPMMKSSSYNEKMTHDTMMMKLV